MKNRTRASLFVSLSLLVYGVYYFTLFPSVPGGDSGELLADSCLKGTSHPPGYPLFLMLSGFARKLPIPRLYSPRVGYVFGEAAWRVNNMCALLGAFAAALIGLTIDSILEHIKVYTRFPTTSAAVGALLFAFSPLIWEYSVTAEVFALNNFLCSAMCYLTVRVYCIRNSNENKYEIETAQPLLPASGSVETNSSQSNNSSFSSTCYRYRYLSLVALGALCTGLALANQHASLLSIVVLAPFTFLVAIIDHSVIGVVGIFALVTISFAAGLSPYAYLFFASSSPKPGSWGDLTTLDGLMTHVLRMEYGTFQLGVKKGSETAWDRIVWYFYYSSAEGYHVIIPLALIGILLVFQRSLSNYEEERKSSSNGILSDKEVGIVTSNQTAEGSNDGTGRTGKKKKNHQKKPDSGNISSNSNSTVTGGTGAPLTANAGGTGGNITTSSSTSSESSATLTTAGSSSEHIPTTWLSTWFLPRKGDGRPLLLCLVFAWLFYITIWHSVFSNLPLSSAMPFNVHSRFWMQPHIYLCIFAGLGAGMLIDKLEKATTAAWNSNKNNKNKKNTISSEISRGKHNLNNVSTATTAAAVPPSHEPREDINNDKSSFSRVFADVAATGLILSLILSPRYSAMDKSRDGGVLHRFGEAILDSIPGGGALLLSHTDLQWNPIRYLQHCEAVRTDILHLNFQLMPFPWFPKQQRPLYPNVTFPDTRFAGVSTDRMTKGNARLVREFLQANDADILPLVLAKPPSVEGSHKNEINKGDRFPAGIYLDMQSVNEVEIEAAGRWRGLILQPWGLVYRVFGPLPAIQLEKSTGDSQKDAKISAALSLQSLLPLHQESFRQLQELQRKFPNIDDEFLRKFPEGSWEYAAASVYYDAHYQLGLNLLTWAMEVQPYVDGNLLPFLIDRVCTAAELLTTTWTAVRRHGAFSSSADDLHKNTAVAWLRLQGLMSVAAKLRGAVAQHIAQNPQMKDMFLWPLQPQDILEEKETKITLRRAMLAIHDFVQTHPTDKDAGAFRQSLDNIRNALRYSYS